MPQTLGRYIIEGQLGEGSFAYVYRARDEDLDRYVALKVLKPAWLVDPAAIARFKQEAKTMARLDKNPHIAVVYEVGEAEGQVYLTQLLVDGETLGQRLARSGPLPWADILAILRDVASALDYAHSQGVIHRDIKPSNILLDKSGRAYLGDFGLVRAAEGSQSLSASIGGGVKGTAAYIPPEVWDGQTATPASDLYALSCVVFEMLTGQTLFEGSSMMAVMRLHDKGPKFPETWPANIPAGVTEVLQCGLVADPAKRIQSAGELVSLLTALQPPPEMKTAGVSAERTSAVSSMWLVSSTGRRYELRPGSMTLGRASTCDIPVNDRLASRQHATLEFDGQTCRIYDEGSANGTFVNGQQVTAAGRPLQPGDQLRIGEITFSLSAALPAEPASPPPVDEIEATIPPVDRRAKTVVMPAVPAPEVIPPLAPPPQAPPRASKGLLAGGALALFGGGAVLLVIVGVILFFVLRPATPTPTPTTKAIVMDTSTPTKELGGAGEVEKTPTPEPTPKPIPTDTPAPTVDTKATIAAAVEATRQAEPTDTPTPRPTSTPLPPTNTPEPTNTPLPTDTPTPILVTITASDGAKMVLVPAGPFEMGGYGGDLDEKPVHTVTLDDFFIDVYEVTNAQYRKCVDSGKCQMPTCTWSPSDNKPILDDTHPIVCVSWEMARTYCEWRGMRLPTEAEWEKAARGTDGRTYPWGNEFDCHKANLYACDDGFTSTSPVGSFPEGVSPYGLYDMAGNVSEWTQSKYQSLPYQANDGRENLDGEKFGRVYRGGNWYSYNKGFARTCAREYTPHEAYLTTMGFRCAAKP